MYYITGRCTSFPTNILCLPDSKDGFTTGCLKKYGCSKLSILLLYFKNGAILRCNIFTHSKYNIHLVVCEVLTT